MAEIKVIEVIEPPVSVKLTNGVKGDQGKSIVSASFVDNDIVFVNDEDEEIVIEGGKTALQGSNAYQVWVEQGNEGTVEDYLASLIGPQGVQGIQGEQGIQGIQGEQGIQGIQGIQGLKGNQWKGAYIPGTPYVVDDVVSYNGSSYICILDSLGNLPSNTTYWSLFAQAGEVTTAQLNARLATKAPITPIASYTYNLNKEVAVSSVDIPTSTFTSNNHGLVNGDLIYPFSNLVNDRPTLLPYMPLLSAYPTFTYYVVNATTNTFQISTTSGGAPITLSTNPTMDLTKWHFERMINAGMTITGLPSAKRYRVVIKGRSCRASSVYLRKDPIITNNLRLWHSSNTLSASNVALGYANLDLQGVTLFMNIDAVLSYDDNGIFYVDSKIEGFSHNTSNISNFDFLERLYKVVDYGNRTPSITGVYFGAAYPANGTTMEVYSL